MRLKKLKLCAILFLGYIPEVMKAQEAIPATGGSASGNGGTASYTVGQVVFTTNSGTIGSVAQGVQQPFEISVVTVIEEAKDISLNFMVYPNPTTDFLIIKIKGEVKTQFFASLFDINGKLLEDIKVEGNETIIEMGKLLPETYFLKITNDNKLLKTFKIVKN